MSSVQTEKVPFVEGDNIGEAYLNSLNFLANRRISHPYLMVHIAQPVIGTSLKNLPESLNIDDWNHLLNLGEVYDVFSRYNFEKNCGRGGSLGKDWINDRIWELLHPEGSYYKKLTRFGQLEMVTERLKMRTEKGGRMHGGCTNALVCQVFHPDEDLVEACRPRPRAKGLSCLTEIDFKPRRSRLNLFSVFRSQYFDTKAYGNLISLAMLLCKVCRETGYTPGTITSTANNITFDVKKRKKDFMEFYKHLS